MQLYFSPMACSLASRIALYEAGLESETTFHGVTLSTKRTDDGADFFAVSPLGQVPALVTREGETLCEGLAVLSYIADLVPDARLLPPAGSFERYRALQWLNYISVELHARIFAVVFNPATPPEAKAYALGTVQPSRFDYLERALADGREYLVGDNFGIADAYLQVVLNWTRAPGLELPLGPATHAYHKRMNARPAAARAIGEELQLAGMA